MTHTETNGFLAVLNKKHAEAAGVLGRREGLAVERTPDSLDEVLFASARELSTRNLERESSLLREVRAALGRIAEGSYGVCLQCEEEISQKRLKAVPWATLCIACQEHSDRSCQPEAEYPGRFLRNAA
jgi:DnaK suppressor protein